MRIAKTEQLKNEIDIIEQNNQRELDSKEAFIQMLDKNLDEAEDQFQIALRNHLIHIENLLSLQDSRIRGLQEEFYRDIQILEEEFDTERQDIRRTHETQKRELEDMIETIKAEENKKMEEANSEHQSQREEVKSRDHEGQNSMRMYLDSRQTKYYNELEQMHQKYVSDTAKKTDEHSQYFDSNRNLSQAIDKYVRMMATKKARIELQKLKIL